MRKMEQNPEKALVIRVSSSRACYTRQRGGHTEAISPRAGPRPGALRGAQDQEAACGGAAAGQSRDPALDSAEHRLIIDKLLNNYTSHLFPKFL